MTATRDLSNARGLAAPALRLSRSGEAVAGADIVVTDTWVSMVRPAEARIAAMAQFQVNESLMAAAAPGALFLHCLPRTGEEVTDAVIDGAQSWSGTKRKPHSCAKVSAALAFGQL